MRRKIGSCPVMSGPRASGPRGIAFERKLEIRVEYHNEFSRSKLRRIRSEEFKSLCLFEHANKDLAE